MAANAVPEATGTGQTALILAAERLFAENGIPGVSLRQVNQAAKQRNISAAHYYFGSREGLVQAVLMHRLPALDQRRAVMLAQASQDKDIRFYLKAFIQPLLDELQPRPEGNYYIRFVQQYEKYRGDYEFVRNLSPAGVQIYDGLEGAICYLPEQVRRLRMGYLINMVHSVFAVAEERLCNGDMRHEEMELLAANTIDMFAAALCAPLSSAMIAKLDRLD